MKLKPIEEQVVVLFGASSGIGREAALQFARRGARVVVSARDGEGLDSLVEEIRQNGGHAVAVTAEATDFDQVKRVAERAVEEFGRLDTWVHLAAVSVYAPFEQTTPAEFKRVVEVNLVGQAYGAMAALPRLRAGGGGALILISSVEGERAIPLHSAYAASKHGVEGLAEALRVELMHEGAPVSVTSVKPASINTPFFEKSRTKLGVQPKGIPPVYEPSLVADAILYATEHPTPEIVVGGAGKAIILLQRVSPRLADALLARIAFRQQRSKKPKSPQAPDALYAPLAGYGRAEGDMEETKPISLYTWLETHPVARVAVYGTILAAVAGAATVARKNQS